MKSLKFSKIVYIYRTDCKYFLEASFADFNTFKHTLHITIFFSHFDLISPTIIYTKKPYSTFTHVDYIKIIF